MDPTSSRGLRRLTSLSHTVLHPEAVGFRGQETESVLSKTVDVTVSSAGLPGTCIVLATAESAVEGLAGAQAEDFSAKPGATCVFYAPQRTVAAGLGPAAEVTSRGVRAAVAAAVKQLKAMQVGEACIQLPAGTSLSPRRIAADVAIAAVLADYNFDIYITDAARKFHISSLAIVSTDPAVVEIVPQAVAIAQGQCLARDMANTRAGIADPQYMEDRAKELCDGCPEMTLSVVDQAEMLDKGMGLIYGVGMAAPSPPRIVYMNYAGDPQQSKGTIALIGKGLCFDTGGLNLKPSGSIETMYTDKHGACTVLGIMQAVSKLKLKVNVVGCMALAENAIGESAQHPHDIVKSMKGLTVHIDNTDAEGRLVLADAFTYTQSHFAGVSTILDFATLTGACMVALGHHAAGVWSNSDELVSEIGAAAAKTADERVWRMPLFPEHKKELEHPECDLKHTGGRAGGANTAASFLEEFIEEGVQWMHLDIAGASGTPGGLAGNGWGVQTIVMWLKSLE